MRPRGLDVEARNGPAAAEDAGPGVPNVDEDPGPEEEDEGIIESGGVGTHGRKRRRMDDGNEDDAEDGNEPPD
jgi:anti-sigma regulatory factor (Ser/Thr protein kinase)